MAAIIVYFTKTALFDVFITHLFPNSQREYDGFIIACIEISEPFYLSKTPMKLVFAIFDLESGERISHRYCNDIIDSIEFKDGRFHQLTTTEPVNCVL